MGIVDIGVDFTLSEQCELLALVPRRLNLHFQGSVNFSAGGCYEYRLSRRAMGRAGSLLGTDCLIALRNVSRQQNLYNSPKGLGDTVGLMG